MAEPIVEQVTLTIDRRQVTVPPGTLLVDAAAALNIEIPVFCSHPKLDPVACCRMCLVEVEGPRGPQLLTACSVPVAEGMVVNTDTEEVRATQEANLTFMLLNHPLDCPICDKGGECPLQDQTMRFGPGISELVEPKRRKKKHYDISDTIVLDQERCVVCWRCIRYLEEWEDKPQLELFDRGGETIIDIQPNQPVSAKTSGNIIDICPVGALTNRIARFAYRPWEIDRTPSICNHCSVGCNLRLDTRTHSLRRIVGRENPEVNDQWICDKGRFAHAWVNYDERLKMPLVRRDGELTPATWSDALQFIVSRLKTVKDQHGADAIGGIGSAKLSNESNYVMQRFIRGIVGTNNVDHRDGAAISALPTGMPSLADVMKPQYGPDPKHDCILLFGVDPSEELPILDVHLKRAVLRGGARLVIAHPRQIELTRYRGPYLGYRPGTEIALLNELAKATLIRANDTDHINEEQSRRISEPQSSEDQSDFSTGVDAATIEQAAALLASSANPLIIYGPMVACGEYGRDVVQGLNNLAWVLGQTHNVAYVGLEANSQGCRDVGMLPASLPGYADLEDADSRQHLNSLWGGDLPTSEGLTYQEMLDKSGAEVQALFIMGADPASEKSAWKNNLANLDLLVVNELLLTETAELADVVLPAVSWAESDGTFTNLERRVQRAPKAFTDQQSKAAPDWLIFDHLASRMGVDWPFADVQSVTEEITKAVPFYADCSWEALGDQGLQWDADAVRETVEYQAVNQPALPPKTSGLTLIEGTAVYDGGNMFWLTEKMRSMALSGIFLNEQDAAQHEITEGDIVEVTSNDAQVTMPAHISDQLQPGTAWIPESQRNIRLNDLRSGALTTSVSLRKVEQATPHTARQTNPDSSPATTTATA